MWFLFASIRRARSYIHSHTSTLPPFPLFFLCHAKRPHVPTSELPTHRHIYTHHEGKTETGREGLVEDGERSEGEDSGGRKKAGGRGAIGRRREGGCCCLSWNREQERATSKRAGVSGVKAAPGSRKERIVLEGFYGVTTWCRVTTKKSQLPAILVRSDPPRQS